MRYRFPYVGADLRKLSHQPGTQRALQDQGYLLVYHAICLFILPAFAAHSFHLTTPGRFRLSIGLGAWFYADVVYSFKDGHPPRH